MQEKYEKAMASVAAMEKRVVAAESMLEATLQYESDQGKAQSSPRYQEVLICQLIPVCPIFFWISIKSKKK